MKTKEKLKDNVRMKKKDMDEKIGMKDKEKLKDTERKKC